MSEQDNAAGPVETPKTAEELQTALSKAEAKIVEMKKTATQPEPVKEVTPEPVQSFDDDAFEKKYAEKKFFESNPDMVEYKDKLTEYTSTGLSYEKAKILVETDDATIANRKVASQTNFTSWDVPQAWQTTYTMEEFAEIWRQNPTRYASMLLEAKQGKIKVGT